MTEQRSNKMDKYGTVCFICNALAVLLLTAVTVVVLCLIGIPVLAVIIISIVLFLLYVWIVERFISILINSLVEKAFKKNPD